MLIKSSLSNSITAEISFASNFGKQRNMELLCDWPLCAKAWQKYPLCDEYPQGSYRESVPIMEENGSTCAGVVQLPRTCSDISVKNDMCASSTPKVDGYVYKRRKLRRNMVALLSEENAEENKKESVSCHFVPLTEQKDDLNGASPFTIDIKDSLCSGIPSSPPQHHPQNPVISTSKLTNSRMSKSVANDRGWVIALPAEVSSRDRCKSMKKKYSNINNRCSSLKYYTRRGSSSDVTGAKTVKDCTEARELCGSFLKRQGLIDGVGRPNCSPPSDILDTIYTNLTQLCKACGHLENSLKMLICDLCEEAFHVSCCNPKVKKPPVDVWYCQPCFRKKRKVLLENSSGKAWLSDIDNGCKVDPIFLMLRDDMPYRSGVRVGKDFQVEVPEWAGPTISDGSDYFDKPLEMDIAESANLPDWNPSEASFIGNWIQCQEVTYDNPEDEGAVCGKWRRAPLFAVQTDDWDCSSALLWDPIHADCAVPQEVETDMVLEHLKCIKMLRHRMANKQRPQLSKS